MPWFKVDDGLHAHRKAVRAGAPAMGLWVLAGSWSADQLTDGWVPDYIAARLDPAYEEHAAALVRAGLWVEGVDEGEPGWFFHDWQAHQPTKEAVEGQREAARERMRRVRENKRSGSAEVRANTTRSSPEVREPVVRQPRPDPTRPDPIQVPSEPAALEARPPQTVTQRSKAITDAYAEAEPMCKWPAVNAIVIKAIKSERFTDDEIRDGLMRLAAEGRGVTVETLRVELQGMPPGNAVALRNGHRPGQDIDWNAAMERAKAREGIES